LKRIYAISIFLLIIVAAYSHNYNNNIFAGRKLFFPSQLLHTYKHLPNNLIFEQNISLTSLNNIGQLNGNSYNNKYNDIDPAEIFIQSISQFWRASWFYVICVIVLISGIYFFIVIRTKSLKRGRSLMTKLVRERTVEITFQNEEIKKQKLEIEIQKIEIEAQRDMARLQRDRIAEQNQSLTESIECASRIQRAMLPPEAHIKKLISDYFIVNKARDIVSGDFYWITRRDEKIVFAVGDCTGHGVPGGFLSMLGVSFLNEIINTISTLKANEILNALRRNIIKSLHQKSTEDATSDGMDISICILDFKDKILQYSGANNPVYIIRKARSGDVERHLENNIEVQESKKIVKNSKNTVAYFDESKTNRFLRYENKLILEKPDKENIELHEVKADKMPISIHLSDRQSFTNNTIKLLKGDSLVLFSDGYIDQFGGPGEKKFRSKHFKELLLTVNDLLLEKQKTIISETFDDWKGELDQVDDVMVMGIKI